MRLPLIPPTNLGAEQRHLYDDMRKGIEANFKAQSQPACWRIGSSPAAARWHREDQFARLLFLRC